MRIETISASRRVPSLLRILSTDQSQCPFLDSSAEILRICMLLTPWSMESIHLEVCWLAGILQKFALI